MFSYNRGNCPYQNKLTINICAFFFLSRNQHSAGDRPQLLGYFLGGHTGQTIKQLNTTPQAQRQQRVREQKDAGASNWNKELINLTSIEKTYSIWATEE